MSEPSIPVHPLTDEEKAVFEWQMWIPDLGEQGQQRLKDASVMISRVGGVGSVVAYELAAAGIGNFPEIFRNFPRICPEIIWKCSGNVL